MKRAIVVGAIALALVACSSTGTTDAGFVDDPLETPLGFVGEPTVAPTPEPTPEPTAAPKPLSIKIVKRTKSVKRNGTASVTIRTAKKARCDIEVEYASGYATAKGLGEKKTNADGLITWKWKVGSNTTKGTWPIYISCELGERTGFRETEFTVK